MEISNNKISIIVPAYNIEQYIERCIRSIIKQTYFNIEIIIVDDGSTDGTGTIVDNLALVDNRIIVIHQENSGVSQARMNGLLKSTGNWIGFVDGDDEIESNMYEELLSNGLKYDADISHCGYQMIFKDSVKYFYNTHNIIEQNHNKGIYDLLIGDYVEPGLWNKIYRKKIIDKFLNEKLDSFDKNIKINEDLLMNYYLFKYADKSIYVDECYYRYMIRNESASRSILNYNRIFDPIKVRDIILKDCDKSFKDLMSYVKIRTIVYTYITLISSKQTEMYKYKSKLIEMIRCTRKNTEFKTFRINLLSFLIAYFSYIFDILYPIYDGLRDNKY